MRIITKRLTAKLDIYQAREQAGFLAFDTIDHSAMLKALADCKIDCLFTDIIEHVYEHATAGIRLHEDTSNFRIRRGVKDMYFSQVVKKLRFTDAIILVTDYPGEAHTMLHELEQASQKVGLSVNFRKTMVLSNQVVGSNLALKN